MTDVDDVDDDPHDYDDRAFDYWEPDCSCYGRGCPQCGVFSPGWRGHLERARLWLRDRRYAAQDRWRRIRRRDTYDDTAPF